ncbi:uncharacterized protein [Euphorbia lathyris]|uniref:uncharacterized protein n=1 Tax=Euphorbia lathyris TaxID=212925 RepID=UPI0033142881
MDAQTTTQTSHPTFRYITVEDSNNSGSRAICKCGKGYRCVITKTTGSDAGKTFTCDGGDCICIIGGTGDGIEANLQQKIESAGEDSAFCECGEGWTCVITTKIDGPVPQCAVDCKC